VLILSKSLFWHTLKQLFLIDVSIINGLTYAIVFSNVYLTEWSMAIIDYPEEKIVLCTEDTLFVAFHAFI